MITKMLFIAGDGRTFDSEEECRNYEARTFDYSVFDFIHLKQKNGVEAWLFDVQSLHKALNNEGFYFLTIDQEITNKTLRELNSYLAEYLGPGLPTEPGAYRRGYEEKWISYEEDYAKFCEKWKCGK